MQNKRRYADNHGVVSNIDAENHSNACPHLFKEMQLFPNPY